MTLSELEGHHTVPGRVCYVLDVEQRDREPVVCHRQGESAGLCDLSTQGIAMEWPDFGDEGVLVISGKIPGG